MKCKKCGAELLDTDTFCIKCGQRADQPMVCASCGEQLREGERFCHKCGSPVEAVAEDAEIPLSIQRTVDIPFDQIEQGILLEAKQAIVKRPEAEKPERKETEHYAYERDETPIRHKRSTPQSSHYEEERKRYREEDYEEDSEDSKMKTLTILMGIIVLVVAVALGCILWQRNRPAGYNGAKGEAGKEQQNGEESGGENAADMQGRIQILSNVNIRSAPTTEGSEVLMVGKQGETYEYYELVDNAWYHIRLEDGRDGYVSAKYVESLD